MCLGLFTPSLKSQLPGKGVCDEEREKGGQCGSPESEMDHPWMDGGSWTARGPISRFCAIPRVLAAGVYPAHAAGIGHPRAASLSQSQLVPGVQERKPLASSDSQKGRGRLVPVCSR